MNSLLHSLIRFLKYKYPTSFSLPVCLLNIFCGTILEQVAKFTSPNTQDIFACVSQGQEYSPMQPQYNCQVQQMYPGY